MHMGKYGITGRADVGHKKEFFGRSAGEMIEKLGSPRTVLTENPHQVWTYRNGACITLVYFDENEKVCFAEERGTCSSLKNEEQVFLELHAVKSDV